jgi:hypothetical protein
MKKNTQWFFAPHLTVLTTGEKSYTKLNYAEYIQPLINLNRGHPPHIECSCLIVAFNIILFQCKQQCKMRQLVTKIGCTGPWIPEVDVDAPLCNEYETMKNLLKDYINK